MKSLLLKLNNGVETPALGLRVYQSSPEETGASGNGWRGFSG